MRKSSIIGILVVAMLPFGVGAETAKVPTLQIGSRGTLVLTVQGQLSSLGYLTTDSITGYYGSLTRSAVQSFQRAKGIVNSGTESSTGYGAVGPKTRAALAGIIAAISTGTISNASSTPAGSASSLSTLLSQLKALQAQIAGAQISGGGSGGALPAATSAPTGGGPSVGSNSSIGANGANTTPSASTQTFSLSPDCTPRATNLVPFEVIQEGGIPSLSDHSLCSQFPFTSLTAEPSISNVALFTNTRSDIKKYAFVWANRCNGGTHVAGAEGRCDDINQGNLPAYTVNGTDYRFFFTTPEKADACTMAQVYHLLGDDAAATNSMNAQALLPLNAQNPSAQVSGGRFWNICWFYTVPTLRSTLTGIVLDYEVADNRSTNQALSFLQTFANYVRGKGMRSVLYINGIANPANNDKGYTVSDSGRHDGIGDSGNGTIAPSLLHAFDWVGLEASGNRTPQEMKAWLAAQVNEYAPSANADYAKIFVQTQIGGSTLDQMRAVHEFVVDNRLGGIDLWNNFTDWSSYTNIAYRQTRCLVYGTDCGVSTPAQTVQPTTPSTAIDHGSVTGTSATPTILGSSSASSFYIVIYNGDGTAVYGSSLIHPDSNGRWSNLVTPPLSFGTYQVKAVGTDNSTLATETLSVIAN